MKLLLYIFNFKSFILGILLAFSIILIGSFLSEFFINKSNHRLSKIFGSQEVDETIFFVGNSRSVPFNSTNLNYSKKILNLSQNSMNSFQVENILKAVKEKQKNKKIIFIELTSIIDNKIQCQYSIFYDLKFYFGKSEIQKFCKKNYYLEKFVPISKINNELFYRIIYYYFFPEKDQIWTNNYKMQSEICRDPKTSHLMSHFFDRESVKKMQENANKLLENYSDNNTEIYYFIAPIYQKINYALNTEEELLRNGFDKLVRLNTLLSNSFFSNCNMFADTLHLSRNGLVALRKNNIFDLLEEY